MFAIEGKLSFGIANDSTSTVFERTGVYRWKFNERDQIVAFYFNRKLIGRFKVLGTEERPVWPQAGNTAFMTDAVELIRCW